jgi:hypothetical protein
MIRPDKWRTRLFVEKIYGTRIPYKRRDSVGVIATGYGMEDRGVGVRVPVGSRIFSSPRSPGRLWSPPNLLSNGHRGLLPRGKEAGA